MIAYDPINDPLDEVGRRRPEWKAGTAILLGNGQTWHFFAPRVMVVTDMESGIMFHTPTYDFGGTDHMPGLKDAWMASLERNRSSRSEIEVADDLLRWSLAALRVNYYIGDDEVAILFGPIDEVGLARFKILSDVLRVKPCEDFSRVSEQLKQSWVGQPDHAAGN